MATRLREDIASLAAIERGSASPGERRSAEWIAGRLREQGGEEVRLQSFPYQGTFAHAHALHYAVGLFAALRGRRALAAAALLSFELDFSGRSQWLRRLLPKSDATNAIARLPARGAHRRTVVLVAHHDAARTGLMWDPRLTGPGDRAAAKSGKRASLALLPELAFLAAATLGWRRLPAALLALSVVLALDQARSPTVPGANDNASGVAGVLELVGRLAAERPDGLELIALFPGCEEAGMGGMAAWLDSDQARALDPAGTLVVGLDTIGSGQPVVLAGEAGLWTTRYRDEHVARAERQGLRPWRTGGWTDPALARLAGLPAISILSVRDGGFPNYHLPGDRPENVDIACVERCLEAALALAVSG